MPSILTTHKILFGEFKPKDLTKIATATPEQKAKALADDKVQKLKYLLGEAASDAQKLQQLQEYLKTYNALPELRQYLFNDESTYTRDYHERLHVQMIKSVELHNQLVASK